MGHAESLKPSEVTCQTSHRLLADGGPNKTGRKQMVMPAGQDTGRCSLPEEAFHADMI
jgi:hypothetical protein